MARKIINVLECRMCHKKTSSLSRNGNCKRCVKEKIFEANSQIKLRRGPIYERYKEKMLKAMGVKL